MDKQPHFHFIGIGGIGMSSLAEMLLEKHYIITGSDLKLSNRIEKLQKKGAEIFIGHHEKNVKEEAIVVFSTDIASDNPELMIAKKRGSAIWHRSELLAHLMQQKKALLVAGAHGKTTTTALLSHVLFQANRDPSFSIGGEVFSLATHGYLGKGEEFVAEADESDGSFLNYHGYGAIVTNVEEEHLNYWKNFEALKKGFCSFIHSIQSPKHLFLCDEDPFLKNFSGIHYGFAKTSPLKAENVLKKEMSQSFDIFFQGQKFQEITIPLLGIHNVLNSLAVFGLAYNLGVSEEQIRKAFLTFQGVKRRLEKIGNILNVSFFDDYAHHPTEIKATLKALRSEAKDQRIIALFQPHRYTRVKSLFSQFLTAFDLVDELFVFEIYSAGEKKEDEKLSLKFFQAIEQTSKVKKIHFVTKESFLLNHFFKNLRPLDVVITLGAGDITDFGKQVFAEWKKYNHE